MQTGKYYQDLHCTNLNLSLEVPENSIDEDMILEIGTKDAANAPPIPCEFGERVLSDVVKIKPYGVQFKIPATLKIKHSVLNLPINLPELSKIVVKWYDRKNGIWKPLATSE